MLDLKTLVIDTKSVWMDFPDLEGFEVQVANLSRKEINRVRKDCTVTKFDRQSRVPMETLNDEKFIKEFARATVKGWKGLKLDYLQTLILIDVEGQDLEEELVYTVANAELLVSGSTEFDQWLNEVVFDLDNFRTEPKKADKGKTNKAI
jgi:hypothetical protein